MNEDDPTFREYLIAIGAVVILTVVILVVIGKPISDMFGLNYR